MRRILSILFLVLFISAWLKPHLPLYDYLIRKEYIARVLCENKGKPELKCNGKCHLAKELKKASAEEDVSSKLPERPKIDLKETYYNMIYQEVSVDEGILLSDCLKGGILCTYSSMSHHLTDTPPPQLS